MSDKPLVEKFLGVVAELMLRELPADELRSMDGRAFEKCVVEYCEKANEELGYGLSIRRTKPQAFPDIVINSIGVEVKSTVKDHWQTTGNSIRESQRDSAASEILFFFGKLGGIPRILVKPYEDCLKSVVVTHNPRYLIDMKLPPTESLFSKMGIDYSHFRTLEDPMATVKSFIRKSLKDGESLWWLDPDTENGRSPILRNIKHLSAAEKQGFLVASLALCPETLGESASKYERLPGILLAQFNAVSANIRDLFSAGGKCTLDLGSRGSFTVRAIDMKLFLNAHKIAEFIAGVEAETLMDSWSLEAIRGDRVALYANLINSKTQSVVGDMLVGDIFLAGLDQPIRR